MIYDPTVEVKRTAIQKSTAFDVSEKPGMIQDFIRNNKYNTIFIDISSSLGDGIKEIKKQMGAEKPLYEGPLTFFPGGSGEADGGTQFYVQLFIKKRTMESYISMDAAKSDPPEAPAHEFYFEVMKYLKKLTFLTESYLERILDKIWSRFNSFLYYVRRQGAESIWM